MPRGKNYNGTITNSCNIPVTHVSVDANSNCFLCNCEGFLPVPVGRVDEFETLEQVWKSPVAQMLQDDIQQKKFSWCAITHCGVVSQSIENPQHSLSINIDDSCNLACPSCRRELRMLEDGPEFEQKSKDLTRILEWLEKFDQPINISLGSAGDALASQLIRNFIKNYKYKPGQTFMIATNGLLLKKIIADSAIRPAISDISISVDAASKEVYEQVRRPGKWSVLMDNLEWLVHNRQSSNVNLNFVLQKTNFRDLPAFANLCQQFGFGGCVTALNDWGTWNTKPVVNPDAYTIANGTYLDHNVADPKHPEHNEFIQVLRTVREKNFEFLIFNPYFDQFK
jgi:MoaA/NifB/PqqE/SkfB family radical SAM enzyme